MERRSNSRKKSTPAKKTTQDEERYIEDQWFENSQAANSGLTFPVEEVIRKMKAFSGMEVTLDAGIYLTSMIQHVIEDILDEAVYKVHNAKTGRIIPKDINEIIKHDTEWSRLFKDVVIVQGGICNRDHFPTQNVDDNSDISSPSRHGSTSKH